MMTMFDLNKKKEINFHKLTEFGCMALFLGGAQLHTLGEKTYGIPSGAYHDETYQRCQCALATFKKAMKSEIKEKFLGKADLDIVLHLNEDVKRFKDEDFREDFLPALHLFKEEWAKFIADEFGELPEEKEAHDDDNVRLQQEERNQPQEAHRV